MLTAIVVVMARHPENGLSSLSTIAGSRESTRATIVRRSWKRQYEWPTQAEMLISGSSRGLFQRRFDNGHVLIDCPAAYADAGDNLTLVGERDAAAQRRVSSA